MKSFFRVIRLSLRYKWSLVGSILCALFIACLWGASIWTVYPFIEVVFEGKTIPNWLEARIESSSHEVESLSSEIESIRTEMGTAAPADRDALHGKITLRETKLVVHEKSRDFYSSLQPPSERWAPKTPFGTLALLMGFLLIVEVIKGVLLVLNQFLVARVSSATTLDLRRIFFRRMVRMDLQKIDKIGSAKLITMVSHNVNLVQAGLKSIYGKSIREPFKFLACLVIACIISWQLFLLSMVLLPLGGISIYYLGRRMKRAMSREIEGYSALLRIMSETLNGIKVVRIYSGQRRERHRFKKHANSLHRVAIKISFFDSLIRPISEVVSVAILAMAILCGAHLVFNQQTHLFGIQLVANPLSAAELIAFFAMLAGMADPMRKMADLYNIALRAVTASGLLYNIIDSPPQICAPASPKPAPRHMRKLQFKDVDFGYDHNSLVLRSINLEIPFGQTVALVGVSGCGKSTLANLVARFYDPRRGRILLDDIDLRDIRPQQVRRQIGLVTQDPFLFQGTIESNIRYGNVRATDEEFRRAIEISGVNDFLPRIPHGLNTQVGERGGKLSGGQRQRTALARALLSDPRILILDEATNQLDAQTERRVIESLRDFVGKRTTILITHRQSTIALADRVVVMENGSIVEELASSAELRDHEHLAPLLAKAA